MFTWVAATEQQVLHPPLHSAKLAAVTAGQTHSRAHGAGRWPDRVMHAECYIAEDAIPYLLEQAHCRIHSQPQRRSWCAVPAGMLGQRDVTIKLRVGCLLSVCWLCRSQQEIRLLRVTAGIRTSSGRSQGRWLHPHWSHPAAAPCGPGFRV